jgi:sulfatase maturation enzyme AslB (radical SAM superfamily)
MERINLLDYENIKFYGGEPLIKWKEVKEIITAVHEKNKDIHFTLITNGLLLTEEKLAFFEKHNVIIAISIHFPAIDRLLSKGHIGIFLRFRDIITFNLLFRTGKEATTTKVFLLLARIGFKNFSLAPVSNDPWKNLDALSDELKKITDYISKYKYININESNWTQLKNLHQEGFCTKEQADHLGNMKACTRFDKLKFIEDEENIKKIDALFNTINWCSQCDVRWFCVCNKWWYLDNFWASEKYSEEQIKVFHKINALFIRFYKEIAKIRNKANYLTSGIDEIRLNLTEQCNLRCEYCYLNFSNTRMEANTGKNIIDFFIEQEGEEKTISFLGGEPLLEFELLREFVLYANSKAKLYNKKVSYKIATNAILLNEEKIEFLKAYDVELHISMNGWKELHDKTRDKSYDNLVWKIQLLHALGYKKEKIIILMVLFPNTINTLKENIESIQKLWLSKIFLEMYIGKKYVWNTENYRELENNLKEVYTLSLKEKDFEIVNFSQKPEKKYLDISTRWTVSDNSLSFFDTRTIDFSPKKYLDTLCQKIYQTHAQ